jgi:AcrR family transcriptional regulator
MFENSRFGEPAVTKKSLENQQLGRRTPLQARARAKIELILEAASRLIERDGLEALTTNRIAELAGVSIGTLYQYFPDKSKVVEALAERELGAITSQALAALTGPAPDTRGGRIRRIVHAAFNAFGGRSRVQRQLLERALAPGKPAPGGGAQRMVAELLTGSGIIGHDGRQRQLAPAEAFVLTQAFIGVLRAALMQPPEAQDRQAIEAALVRLVLGFFASDDMAPGNSVG